VRFPGLADRGVGGRAATNRGPLRSWKASRGRLPLGAMTSTAYTHRALTDLLKRENRAYEAHSASSNGVDTFGTPRRRYRPVLGVTGTLQADPNPCMGQDFDVQQFRRETWARSENGPQSARAVLQQVPSIPAAAAAAPLERRGEGEALPRLDLYPQPRNLLRPDRTAEADLSFGVPPHQVHHHNFGWTLAGTKPVASMFSARRPWGIGLQYSHDINHFSKQIRECPGSPRGFSPPRGRSSAFNGHRTLPVTESKMPWKQSSLQASTAQLSTAAPSDIGGYADSDVC